MKQTLLTLCLILFALPSWGDDLKPVQDCEDIIFNNPELKVEVSDWELDIVSFFMGIVLLHYCSDILIDKGQILAKKYHISKNTEHFYLVLLLI